MALTKVSGSILKDPLNLGEVSIGGTLTYQDVTNVDSIGIITARSGIHIDDSIVHIGDTNTKIRFPANDTISFETSGSEKFRIQPNGRVGIGTDNPPDCTLTVCEFNSGTNISDNIALRLQGSTGQNVALQFTDTTGAAAYIAVQGDALRLGTNNAERLRITSAGFVQVGDGTVAAEAPLHVTAENSQGINAIFGAKDFVPANNYNYADANIALQGRDAGDSDTGAGIQFTVRNTGNSNWLHGAITMDQSSNYIFKNGGAGTTVGTEKLRINSNGAVSIASNNYASGHADTKLRVGTESGSNQATVVIGSADQDVPALIITNWDGAATTNKNVIRFDNSGRGTYEIGGMAGVNEFGIFLDNFTTPKLKINSTGNVSITDGNLAVASGHGIDFSVTSDAGGMTSELLDDYEEGSWTPICAETISSITSARYTKIGRMVHYQFYINMGASSSTSTFTIAGLPFTAGNANQYHYGTGRINGQTFVTLQVNSNANGGHVYVTGSTTLKFNAASNAYVLISGVYEAT